MKSSFKFLLWKVSSMQKSKIRDEIRNLKNCSFSTNSHKPVFTNSSNHGSLLEKQLSQSATLLKTGSVSGSKSRPFLHNLGFGLSILTTLGTVSTGAWILAGEDPFLRAKTLYTIPVRLSRDISTALMIIADYRVTLGNIPLDSVERERAKHECHLRCARRLQELCFRNGGIYIKLGQHISQLDYVLPQEYVQTMRDVMLNRCPTSSYEQVCEVFFTQLGCLPSEAFASFNPIPIASASLAQVHEAYTHSGQRVAVKVQHKHLTDTAVADTATVRLIITAIHWMFPDYDYRWLIKEVEESLPRELDFIQEGRNAERCRDNFGDNKMHNGDVIVPEILWKLSSQRILTMEFMEGVNVTDVAEIERMGLDPADVARLVSTTFAKMIFRHGFVHCDPHAANVLVRPMPASKYNLLSRKKKPQLVLLDHGLYRSLDENIRTNYAGLWEGLIFADVAKIKQHSVGLGAGEDLHTLFASILTLKDWESIQDAAKPNHLALSNTHEEKKQLQEYASIYMKDITQLFTRLPRVVLLLLKTNDCLRSIDNALGSPINSFVIIARECTNQISSNPSRRFSLTSGLEGALRKVWLLVRVEFRLFLLRAYAWMHTLHKKYGVFYQMLSFF